LIRFNKQLGAYLAQSGMRLSNEFASPSSHVQMFQLHGKTHGMVTATFIGTRAKNEDAIETDLDLGCFSIADGIGGRPDGDLASKVATKAALTQFRELSSTSSAVAPGPLLKFCIEAAHAAVVRENWGRRPEEKMATTIALVSLSNSKMHFAHSGDCRLYLIDQRVNQLTKDHTVSAELRDKGVPYPSHSISQKSTLTQCLGLSSNPNPQVDEVPILRGDRVFLCTDGFYRTVFSASAIEWIYQDSDFRRVCDNIVLGLAISPPEDNASFIALQLG
jgi:PPM family protein phosphatase